MNAFTTDHPMVARPSCSDAKDNPLLSFCGSAVLVALVLCPLFLGVTWFAALGGDSPDVPQPSSAEFIFDAVGFILAFPAFFSHSRMAHYSRESVLRKTASFILELWLTLFSGHPSVCPCTEYLRGIFRRSDLQDETRVA